MQTSCDSDKVHTPCTSYLHLILIRAFRVATRVELSMWLPMLLLAESVAAELGPIVLHSGEIETDTHILKLRVDWIVLLPTSLSLGLPQKINNGLV